MPQRVFDPTERIGVNAVEAIVTGSLNWIWREQQTADFGIDGQIETVDGEGKPTGQLFGVQVKSGPSYFRGTGETIPFYVDDDHLKYWHQHALPVILVLHNPGDGETLWQWADLTAARPTEKRWRIDIPRTKRFSAESRAELHDRVWTDDSVGIRRRFALDRQFMSEFRDRDGFVTIDDWVNKSWRFREIEIRFDDPDKELADYEIPILVTWGYAVADVMRYFFPWLEYEYHEEPDDSCAEVERHVMVTWLSQPAKAFLEVEAFFDNPARLSEVGDADGA